jgi:hypothetical protein
VSADIIGSHESAFDLDAVWWASIICVNAECWN